MSDSVQDLDAWRAEALEQWQDERILSREALEAAVWFFQHSWADFVNLGLTLEGYSFRQDDRGWLMVVKVVGDDIPQVGFVGSKTPTGCMRRLRDAMRNGGLRLSRDKYR